MSISTLAKSCVLIDNLQYSLSPGFATNLCANSRWNIKTAHRKNGRCSSNLKTNGDEIWYGIFATHRSKKGSSVFNTSPTIICSFCWYGVPCTRFCNSATNLKQTFVHHLPDQPGEWYLVSISHATTFLTRSSILTVMFPVPGPISKTTSVGRRPAFSNIVVIIMGFLRMCWPKSLLKRIPGRILGYKKIICRIFTSFNVPCFAITLCTRDFFSALTLGILHLGNLLL